MKRTDSRAKIRRETVGRTVGQCDDCQPITGPSGFVLEPRKNSPRNIFEPPIIKLSTVSSRHSARPRRLLLRRAGEAPSRQAGSRLHNHRMPSHLFSCHHGCSRDIKRQFKDDWTMTHDTPAIGRTRLLVSLSLSLSLSLFLCFASSPPFLFLFPSLYQVLSLPWRRAGSRRIFPRPVDIGQNVPVSVAVGTCAMTRQ